MIMGRQNACSHTPLRPWVSGGDGHELSGQCPAWRGDCPGFSRRPSLRHLGEANSGAFFLPSLFPGGFFPGRHRNGLSRRLVASWIVPSLWSGQELGFSISFSPEEAGLLVPGWLPLLGRRCWQQVGV